MHFLDESVLHDTLHDTRHELGMCNFTHAPVLTALVRSTRCLFRLRPQKCCLCLCGRRGPQNTRWWTCPEKHCACTAHANCVAKWLCTQITRERLGLILKLDDLSCFVCRRATRFLCINVNCVEL